MNLLLQTPSILFVEIHLMAAKTLVIRNMEISGENIWLKFEMNCW